MDKKNEKWIINIYINEKNIKISIFFWYFLNLNYEKTLKQIYFVNRSN